MMTKNKGYTLVELMLYISLAALILSATSVLLTNVVSNKVKNQAVLEVEQQGAQVMKMLTDSIQSADNVDSPLPGAAAQPSITLDFAASEATKDPTLINLSGTSPDQVQITEGAASAVKLTSTRVNVSNLSFRNVSGAGGSKSIKISFDMSHYNPGGRNESSYTQTFYGSASLR